MLGLIIAPHQSFAEEEGFQGVIINQLSTKNFSTKFNVVEDIVQSNNPKVKYILNSLLAGSIYLIKSTKQVVFALKDDKQYIASGLINNEPLGVFTKAQVSKIGINNKTRKIIKLNLALLDLSHPEESVRLKAVKNTYKSINQDIVNTMQLLLKTDESKGVKKSMLVVISNYNLNNDNQADRIKAIESVKGNLEPIVKVQLKKLIDNDLDE